MSDKNGETDMSIMKQTNILQGNVIKTLNPERYKDLDIIIMESFGLEWRKIINEFLQSYGRLPSEDDIIWCSSLPEHLGKDIRLIVQEFKKQLNSN